MEMSRNTLKRGILLSVSVSIVAIVLVMVLTQSNYSLETFSQIDSNYLVLAAVITIIFWLLKSLKLKVLIHALGGRVSIHKVFSIYLASAFVSHVTPSSSGGFPFQIYFLHKEGLPLGKTTAVTVFDSMLTFVFVMIITPFLLLACGKYLNMGPAITHLFYIALVLVVAFIVGSLILIFNAHLTKSFANWLTGLGLARKLFKEDTLKRFRDFIEKEVEYFNEGMHLLLAHKKDMFLVIIYTILYWFFYLSLAPVLLKGLGVNVTVPSVILAQLVFNFIQPIIPTPGGSGGAELSFAYLFKFMVPKNLLGVFVAIWRFFMFYSSMIVGGICFIHLVQGTDYLGDK